ncbi:MAG: hypothetical protein DRQ78_09895 [Epsilonproteobacteria bacterium]|nr:MAG: hypothetical protein DRQ78_09895 [Campylobacterota bacterium]
MKEIIEIIVSTLDHLNEDHIIACARQHMIGCYNYDMKGKVKIRTFTHLSHGGYNRSGDFITPKKFRSNLDMCSQACYDEVIEAEFSLVRI